MTPAPLTAALAVALAAPHADDRARTAALQAASVAEQRRAGKTPDPALSPVIFVDEQGADLYCGYYHKTCGTLSSQIVAAWLESQFADFFSWYYAIYAKDVYKA